MGITVRKGLRALKNSFEATLEERKVKTFPYWSVWRLDVDGRPDRQGVEKDQSNQPHRR